MTSQGLARKLVGLGFSRALAFAVEMRYNRV